jgi:hypothetical protein
MQSAHSPGSASEIYVVYEAIGVSGPGHLLPTIEAVIGAAVSEDNVPRNLLIP